MARHGMAYNYNLGGQQNAAQQRAEAFKEQQQTEAARQKEMHENLRDSLAVQAARLQAATQLNTYTREMQKMQDAEQVERDSAAFRRMYGLVKNDDPNRKAQIAALYDKFPGAIKSSEIQSQVSQDNKDIEARTKPELSPQDAKFLKENGPGSKGWDKLQTSAADPTAADHITAAINYGHAWDLLKKQVGMQSGTPEGTSMDDYVKNIQSKFEKLPNGQPNPAYQPPTQEAPAPSTPAPQNAQDWANTDLSGKTAPVNVPASTQPATAPATTAPAAPTSQHVQDFLKNMGLNKTSDAGAAAAATTNRNELNDMLNQSPETQFAAPKPQPSPTPTPEPNKEQYYTA